METPQLEFTTARTSQQHGHSVFGDREFCPDASMDGNCIYCTGPETD